MRLLTPALDRLFALATLASFAAGMPLRQHMACSAVLAVPRFEKIGGLPVGHGDHRGLPQDVRFESSSPRAPMRARVRREHGIGQVGTPRDTEGVDVRPRSEPVLGQAGIPALDESARHA